MSQTRTPLHLLPCSLTQLTHPGHSPQEGTPSKHRSKLLQDFAGKLRIPPKVAQTPFFRPQWYTIQQTKEGINEHEATGAMGDTRVYS